MNFRIVCTVVVVIASVFGLGFLLFPELVSAFYGISGWNPGTTFVARLYGGALLLAGSAAFAVRGTADSAIQRSFGFSFAVVNLVCAGLSLHSVTSGSSNALTWSTVALFAVFAAVWLLTARGATAR